MQSLRAMFVNMLQIPENGDRHSLRYSQIKYFIGFVDVRAGRPSRAVTAFKESLLARPGAGHAMAMAALLASNGYLLEALDLSGIALLQLEAKPANSLQGAIVSKSDVQEFRANIRAELAAAESGEQSQPELQ
jgi:hypothetical protein